MFRVFEVNTSKIQKVAYVFRPSHSLVCTECDLNNFFSCSKNETLREKKCWNNFFSLHHSWRLRKRVDNIASPQENDKVRRYPIKIDNCAPQDACTLKYRGVTSNNYFHFESQIYSLCIKLASECHAVLQARKCVGTSTLRVLDLLLLKAINIRRWIMGLEINFLSG